MTENTNPAISGTYTIHRTTAALGTKPARVKPICGQSTRQSYLSVTTEESVDHLLGNGLGKLCKKCH